MPDWGMKVAEMLDREKAILTQQEKQRDNDDDWKPDEEPFQGSFENAEFIAHLRGNIRFSQFGEMMMTFAVPARFKDDALGMVEAVGVPLIVRVERLDFEAVTANRKGVEDDDEETEYGGFGDE